MTWNIKMETRSIKELLEILLDNINELDTGLCELTLNLYLHGIIIHEEETTILSYLNKYYNYYQKVNLNYFINVGSYYWPMGQKEPRIKWLKRHIKKNS